MSFLNQLKSQAKAVQSAQTAHGSVAQVNAVATELAAKTTWFYLTDLARQLDVIKPDGPKISLDGKHHWPPVKLGSFTADFRKKILLDKEVYDRLTIGWTIATAPGMPGSSSVSADFSPELNRIEARLAAGHVPHERVNVRDPVKNTLKAIRFDHKLEARASVVVTCEHDAGQLAFRLGNLTGLEVLNKTYPATQVNTQVLDELAKMICGQPSSFF